MSAETAGTQSEFMSTPPARPEVLNEKVAVKLPNLFCSFASTQPPLNPHYEDVKLESEQWLVKFCSLSPPMQMKLQKLDFSYFCAIMAPFASREEYRTLCDWGNWVFPYDDMFDGGELGGELKDDPIKSRKVVDSLLEPFREGRQVQEGRLRIVEAHDDVVNRMSSTCSPGVTRRFLHRMEIYSQGVLLHLDDHFDNQIPTPEQMIEIRRKSAGSGPLYHLIEYAHRLNIPDEIFENPIIKELEDLGMEMVGITNDMVSYPKEEGDGCNSNIVAACRMSGMGAQQAFDYVGKLLHQRYQRWDAAEFKLPSWGGVVDAQVQMYIEGIKGTVRANLYWSFRTKRYLGRDPEEVKRTGIIYVLEHPPYLAESQRNDASTSSMVSESTFEVSQKQLVKSSGWIEELRTLLRALFKRFRPF